MRRGRKKQGNRGTMYWIIGALAIVIGFTVKIKEYTAFDHLKKLFTKKEM